MSGWGAIYNSTVLSIHRHSQDLARIQEQIASGRRVIRASDDPSDANRILERRFQSASLDTYIANIDAVMMSLEQASSALGNTSTALIRVGELLTQAGGVLNQDQRDVVAEEIDGLLEQVVQDANRASLGTYIFGGVKSSTAPYSVQRSDGKIYAVQYQGSQDELPVPVASSVDCSGLLVGDDIFRSHARAAPVFFGKTGAQAGTGTSNAVGDLYLTVEHYQTSYEGNVITAGADSALGDTIVGSHTLTINADQTLQLDGGAAVSFAGDTTNVAVTNSDGEVVYVDIDTDAWDGQTADIAITATAKLSIDDGVTTTITDLSSDVAVADADGHVLYVNPTGITSLGTDPVRIPGTHDVFEVLINLRDLLTNERNFSESDQKALFMDAASALREVSGNVVRTIAVVGSRIQAMDFLRTNLDGIRFNATTEADALEEADIIAIAMNLARSQTLYQMTLQTAGKLLSMSLLDFI